MHICYLCCKSLNVFVLIAILIIAGLFWKIKIIYYHASLHFIDSPLLQTISLITTGSMHHHLKLYLYIYIIIYTFPYYLYKCTFYANRSSTHTLGSFQSVFSLLKHQHQSFLCFNEFYFEVFIILFISNHSPQN